MKILLTCVSFFVLASHLGATEIPHSITRLNEIKDKESDEYTFLSHQAAMDARLAATSALEGKNSSGALKILGTALEGMPHRTDLKDLRNKALSTYIGITKKLEEDVTKNCELLKERYSFLKNFAPDSLNELAYDQRCVAPKVTQAEPRYLKKLENEFKADVTHSTRDFPYIDVLNNSFMLFTSLFGEDFKISCSNFVIAGDKVKASCASTKKKETTYKEVSQKYCKFMNELLLVSGGPKSVRCTIDNLSQVFQTSDAIYNVYVAAVDNSSFDEDLPVLIAMNMMIKQKERSHVIPVVLTLNQKNFKAGKFPTATLEKANEPYYFEKLDTVTSFELAPDDLKDLEEISFAFNLKHTYETYKTHYETAIKSDLSCQESRRLLTGMDPSRKKMNLEDSLKKNCAEKGNLRPRLLDTL